VKALVLTLRFVSELAMLAVLGWWGADTGGSGAAAVALAVALPLAAIAVWGRWVAPTSDTRLRDPGRLVVELVLFDAAAAALWDLADLKAALAFLAAAAGLAAGTRLVGEELPAR
jgi:hypothetical protein